MRIQILFVLLSLPGTVFPVETISPIRTVLSQEIVLEQIAPAIIESPSQEYASGVDGIGVFDLHCGETELSISVFSIYIESDDKGFDLMLYPYYTAGRIQLDNLRFSLEQVQHFPGNLETEKTSVRLNNEYLPLEMPEYEILDTKTYHYKIDGASLSHDKTLITGTGEYYKHYPYPDMAWDYFYPFFIWDAVTGKIEYEGYNKIPKYDVIWNVDDTISCFFSPGDRYIAVTYLHSMTMIDGTYFGTVYSYLFDRTTETYLTTGPGLSFTRDGLYYLTERDGLPSLVDAETGEVLICYDPGDTMTACCFSPDETKLYIACEDLQIYEFESQLPVSSVRDWELYE